MPRPRSLAPDQIVEQCMGVFWNRGYAASSVDDLVQATGTTRHSIYLEFGGKAALFEKCLVAYSATIVTPAFGRVESGNRGVADIADYFEYQLALAEKLGLPGPGCLMANTLTDAAAHGGRAAELVRAHQERLRAGFARALAHTAAARRRHAVRDHAQALVVFANGLWSMCRISNDAAALRASAKALLRAIENDLGGGHD